MRHDLTTEELRADAQIAFGGMWQPQSDDIESGPSVDQTKSAIGWCRSDPTVTINGETVEIWVAGPESLRATVTDATEFVVSVPVGTDYAVIFKDEGFGLGESVTFNEVSWLTASADHTPMHVEVHTPARDSQPTSLEIIAKATGETLVVEGPTNTRYGMTFAVPRTRAISAA